MRNQDVARGRRLGEHRALRAWRPRGGIDTAAQPLPGIVRIDLGRALQRQRGLQLALEFELLAAVRTSLKMLLHHSPLGFRRTTVDDPRDQVPGPPVRR